MLGHCVSFFVFLVVFFVVFFFFFFQAEDGIRDPLVTGVQTCALPIWRVDHRAAELRSEVRALLAPAAGCGLGRAPSATVRPVRSEERRVGKECRSRWWRYH